MRDRRPVAVRGRTWPKKPIDGNVAVAFDTEGRVSISEMVCVEPGAMPGALISGDICGNISVDQARALHRHLVAALAAWDGSERHALD